MEIDKLNILIIDDHMIMRNLIKNYCESYGFKNIDFASNGVEGLKKIQENDFHIILADWNMPEMNGPSLLKHVRSDVKYDDVAFAMITAESETLKVMGILNAGATTYLVKPFSQEIFETHISKIIDWLEDKHKGI